MAVLRRIRNLLRRSHMDREIDAELKAHIEMRIEDNITAGMTPGDARRNALVRFGNRTAAKERTVAADASLALDSFWRDLRYAARQLGKAPVFALTTVLTLALGIGATTAIFSTMHAVLLRLLPVANPKELFFLHLPDGPPYKADSMGDSETSFSLPVFKTLRQNRHAFSEVMAFAPLSNSKVAVRFGDGLPEQAAGDVVSGNFFSGLGVATVAGRALSMADEKANAPVAVLSYAYWTSRFSRNPGVVGRTIVIKGISFTIVGVAAEGFPGLKQGESTDLWIPLQRRPELDPWGSPLDQTLYGSPDWWCLRLLARLAPGVSAQQAIAEVSPSFDAEAYARLAALSAAHPRIALSAVAAKGVVGLGDFNEYGQRIKMLMALVTLVLVIACSNVAMLIVARNAVRQRDFSLRMALGAGRRTLLRQLLVESGILVLLGSLSGWFFAVSATRALASWADLEMSLAPDWKVLLFTGAVSAIAALVFALAPMRAATNAPVTSALRTAPATTHQSKRWGSTVLVVQIALCFTLLTTSGLLFRTLLNYEHTNLGMQTQGLLVFGITPQKETTDEARFRFYRTLLERMRSLPGVEAATFVGNRLGSGWSSTEELTLDGISYSFSQVPLRTNVVGPQYLHVLGIPLLEGRDIRESDTATSQHVVIVNETFVKKLLPNTNPIGHQLGDLKKDHSTIVGVAKDSKYRSVDEAPRAMAYYPYTQNDEARSSTLQVELRTTGNPTSMLPTVERVVHTMDPDLPLEKPMEQSAVFEDSYLQQRLFSRLAMFFALLAALLVGIGLYGTLFYRINRKTSEIGIRMALGAKRRQVLSMVLCETFQIAVVGIAAGIPLALLAGHFMGSMLYELKPDDKLSLAAALVGIVCVSLAASFNPARRASSIDTARALRSE
jgi:predicted permease